VTEAARKDLRFTTLGDATPRRAQELPPWFVEAVATPHEVGAVDVDGATISYRAWGSQDDPLVILVHGGGAHAGWWDHIAPLLADGRRVVAPDLSGHGDSAWRAGYSFETWADEVMAVAGRESAQDDFVLVGHSMGGCVGLTAASRFEARLRGLCVIDSLVAEVSPEVQRWRAAGNSPPDHRVYADLETAVERFRALPADPTTIEFVRRHVARESLVQVAGGWRWKFDPAVYFEARFDPGQVMPVSSPIAVVSGERGLSTPEVIGHIASGTRTRPLSLVIPDAGHHIPLEQPVALISVLRVLLDLWKTAI
jgi:pimeloyl-ACP methyl ester carboxylesterase